MREKPEPAKLIEKSGTRPKRGKVKALNKCPFWFSGRRIW